MIPVLRSLDRLLNRFDELSKCHTNFISNFNVHFPSIKNPLRDVTRSEEEQKKTSDNILLVVKENSDRRSSTATIEDFHRRMSTHRYHHRPPVYSSNDNLSFSRVPSRTSSVMIDSKIMPQIKKKIPMIPSSNTERKVNIPLKIKPKVVTQNLSVPRRFDRGTVTEFSMETVNRLAKPKIYPELLNQKPVIRRLKPYATIKKEPLECPTVSSFSSLRIKRTKSTPIKPFVKKFKADNKTSMSIPKCTFVSKYPSPYAFHTPIPTIYLTLPLLHEQKSPRVIRYPKTILTNRHSMLYYNLF